ncbi:hypothetical protein [Kribbella sp. CA-247076]|uniref:hypothetical protein n=1 Tax=Kribbella sp. CA-247076 TaxID=3239941 RepID=UPI003D8ACB5F
MSNPRWIVATFVVVVLACGIGGGFVGESVVGAVGRAVNHSELGLRVLGWCWGGLPYVVIAAVFVGRTRLSRAALLAMTYLLAVWVASGALLIPGRTSSLEDRFGSAYPDARPLSFGWACGFLAAAATLLLIVVGVLVLKRLRRAVTKRDLQKLSTVLTTAGGVLALGGLVGAVFAPMP